MKLILSRGICIIRYQTNQPVPSPQPNQPNFAVVLYVQKAPLQIYPIKNTKITLRAKITI